MGVGLRAISRDLGARLGRSALANPGQVIIGWDGFTDPSGYVWSSRSTAVHV
jgi:hypothetical protein